MSGCVEVCPGVSKCVEKCQEYVGVCRRMSNCVRVFGSVSECVEMCRKVSAYAEVCHNMSKSVSVWWSVPKDVEPCRCLEVCPGLSKRVEVSEYVRVCRRMWECAVGCQIVSECLEVFPSV